MDPVTTPTTDTTLDTPASEVSSGADTVEGVEEFWRKRMAGKERAWNAEAMTLREQNESLQRRAAATPANGDAPEGGDQRVVELQRQLEAERQARVVTERKLRFPALAAQNPGDTVFVAADEATLAKLNVLAEDGNNGTFIAPTSPRRAAPATARTLAELDDDAFKAAFKQRADALDMAKSRT